MFFLHYDKDKDGKLDYTDFKWIFNSNKIKMSSQDIKLNFNQIDKDNKNFISFSDIETFLQILKFK